ncbi:hypothetical protein LG315_10555 [Microbacterium marinum]|uniref:hypothetical protein n=1 Tax=Microbacterium marinum TaxID=421115 RepID=UPI00384E9226
MAVSSRWGVARLLLSSVPFRAAFLVRVAQYAPPVARKTIAAVNLTLHGIDVDPRASLGPGLLLQHPVGVVIGGGAVVGARCTIMSGAVLGRQSIHSGSDPNGYPKLGDNVLLGTGATVLGDTRIGNHGTIGAKSLVIRDVRAGATVVGIPARETGSLNQSAQKVVRSAPSEPNA